MPISHSWSLRTMCFLMAVRSLFYYQILVSEDVSLIINSVVPIFIIIYVLYVFSKLKRANAEKRLETGGIFSLVAHPLYFLYVLLDISLWFYCEISAIFVITSILFISSILLTAYKEENELMRYYESAEEYYKKTLSVFWLLNKMC